MNRIIDSFRKVSSVAFPAFSVSIIILAFDRYITGNELSPTDVFGLAWMYMSIHIIATVIRALEDCRKWAGLPYWIKRLISMPLFIAVVVTALPPIFDVRGRLKFFAVLTGILFAVIYIIASMVNYYSEKKETDAMNDALLRLKKEIIDDV